MILNTRFVVRFDDSKSEGWSQFGLKLSDAIKICIHKKVVGRLYSFHPWVDGSKWIIGSNNTMNIVNNPTCRGLITEFGEVWVHEN